MSGIREVKAFAGVRDWGSGPSLSTYAIKGTAQGVRIAIGGALARRRDGEDWKAGWRRARKAGWRVIRVVVSPDGGAR